MLTRWEQTMINSGYHLRVSWTNEYGKNDFQYFMYDDSAALFAKTLHASRKRVTVDGYIDTLDEFITLYVLD